jgi:hypothetical protein
MVNALVSSWNHTKTATLKLIFSFRLVSAVAPRPRIIRCLDDLCKADSISGNSCAHADWYLLIRDSERVYREPPTAISTLEANKFTQSILRYQHGRYFDIPPVFIACIHHAKLYSRDLLVLTGDNRLLYESALSRDEVLSKNGILTRLFSPRSTYVPGQYCLLSNPWADGYYHWLLDAIPRLSVVKQFEELAKLPLIVHAGLRPYQRETLSMLGISAERLVAPTAPCWHVDTLYYPELLSETGNPSPHAVAWLRKHFLEARQPSVGPAKRRLYISRQDAAARRLANEEEIVDFLRDQAFEVICPGEFSVAAQIEIFRDAAIVVAAHGAGCTNMVFAPPGAILLELFGDNYINGCFWALANLCSQRYAFLTGPPVNRLDYAISIDSIKTMLWTLTRD